MLYRLAFRTTSDGYLQIMGSAKGLPPVRAIHFNDEVFERALERAHIPAAKTMEILAAARQAWPGVGIDVYCEAVELSPEQLENLRLLPPRMTA